LQVFEEKRVDCVRDKKSKKKTKTKQAEAAAKNGVDASEGRTTRVQEL